MLAIQKDGFSLNIHIEEGRALVDATYGTKASAQVVEHLVKAEATAATLELRKHGGDNNKTMAEDILRKYYKERGWKVE